MRYYKDQFGQSSKIARRIERLATRIEQIQYPTDGSRYYGKELTLCLHGGTLLGSVLVAAALLEI